MLVLASLGVTAGLITTLCGFGGGVFLVTCLALRWNPLTALTISSIALFVGNAHRLLLFRQHFQWRFSAPVILGVMPGALGGALLATRLPALVLQLAILVAALAALARVLVKSSATLPHTWLWPGSSAVGFLSATTGGGGFLLGPLLLSAGARGGTYIATGASAGVAVHCFRITGYSTTGLVELTLIFQAALLAVSIMLGNIIGRVIRRQVGDEHLYWLEYATPVLCAGLAFGAVI